MRPATHTRGSMDARSRLVRALVCSAAVIVAACGDSAPPPPVFGGGGSSGTGGTAASGGTAGTSGTAGRGLGGAGGDVGGGGTGGAGGAAGTGGISGGGGGGGVSEGCVTNALCHTCPTATCNVDSDCPFDGSICVPSGCTFDGEPQKECQPSRGGSCDDISDCPDEASYECKSVAGSPPRCVRVAPGCSGATESYDCAPGFSCEEGACVDRRVPCESFLDCPKNHVCANPPTSSTRSFCVRVFRTCHEDTDCSGFGRYCVDIDGDGRKECAGDLGGSGEACVNADCAGTPAPVCEAGGTGTSATCGDHGLCQTNADCDTASDFVCAALRLDGRKECVPAGGDCSAVTDCPIRQVCAAARNGNPPSCQAGAAP